MKVSAELNYLRMAPRKVRLVAAAIRGKRVPDAERTLRFLTRRAARPLEKLLASAVANARHNFRIERSDMLTIADIRVGDGPTLKRSRAGAFGRQFPIGKRTSHVTLTLEAAGAAPPRPVLQPAAPQPIVVPRSEAAPESASARHGGEGRRLSRERATPLKRSTDFVRRMFRRKAI